jgi:hypothetical protein
MYCVEKLARGVRCDHSHGAMELSPGKALMLHCIYGRVVSEAQYGQRVNMLCIGKVLDRVAGMPGSKGK